MFFCFFEGIQFLAFLANRYKNLENGKTLSSFFKYLPNVFNQNFAVRKSVQNSYRQCLVDIFLTMLMTGIQ